MIMNSPSRLARTDERAMQASATDLLRDRLLEVHDIAELMGLFARALMEHGVRGHFIVSGAGYDQIPINGDAPELTTAHDAWAIRGNDGMTILLANPDSLLSRSGRARLTGYAQLYAARVLALSERDDDVETGCGLSLRERFVLGRLLAGCAPVDIAVEAQISMAAVEHASMRATERLGAVSLADAIAVAARRGWLAVTSLENCSLTVPISKYNRTQNG